jgi:hypothetical protein
MIPEKDQHKTSANPPFLLPNDYDWNLPVTNRYMTKIAEKEFVSVLTLETSMSATPTKLGKHTSTMTLYGFELDPNYFFIEWDIPTLDEVENIGIWCEDGTKELRDYDGVFELPLEAIELLQENGFNTAYAE